MEKIAPMPVFISVKSTRIDIDGNEDIVKTFARGKKSDYNGKIYIQYKEPEQSGLFDTNTLLKWQDNSLALTRTGEVEHKQEFKVGKLSPFTYKTPAMCIPMVVETKILETTFSDKKLYIYIEYQLFIANKAQGKTKLRILVWEDTKVGHKRAVKNSNSKSMH